MAPLAAVVAPPPAAVPSAAIAQAQQKYQDATLRQSRNIHIVEGPSALGSDRRLIREEICTRVVRKGKGGQKAAGKKPFEKQQKYSLKYSFKVQPCANSGLREGSVDKFRARYESYDGQQSLDRAQLKAARPQRSNDYENYRSLDRSKSKQQSGSRKQAGGTTPRGFERLIGSKR